MASHPSMAKLLVFLVLNHGVMDLSSAGGDKWRFCSILILNIPNNENN